MKRFLILVMVSTLATSFLVGCDSETKIEIEPTETISTSVNQEFTISRGVDLNSGYSWREDYDDSILELLDSFVDSEKKADGRITLVQVFRFKALEKGTAVITLVSARRTMDELIIARQDIIRVDIK
jgi:predicted secreted protein